MSETKTVVRKQEKPKEGSTLVEQYRAIGPASLAAALECAEKKKKTDVVSGQKS